MEFGRAFSHAQQDPEWLKKVGIAALIFLIPLVGPITVLGWGLEITRRVINNDPATLPDWSNFTDHLVRGLKGFVISLVFSLPGSLVSGCLQSMNAIVANPEIMNSMDGDMVQALTSAMGVLGICCGCLGFILSLGGTFLMPAALGNMMANNGELGAGFRFGEIIALIRAAVGPYLMTLLGTIIVGIIVPFGLIACVVGVFFMAAWGTTVTSHLYGQAYNAAKSAQAAAPAM